MACETGVDETSIGLRWHASTAPRLANDFVIVVRADAKSSMKRILLLAIGVFGTVAGVADPAPAPLTPFLLEVPLTSTALMGRVDSALAAKIVTIVNKPQPSPTGDAHDYVSYARYWWPDPAKPGGLPFIRNDGHSNVDQVKLGDEPCLGRFTGTVESLALGWAVLNRSDCARRAGEWLRAWFVDPATRMKPALDYAQIRLGHENNLGSASGVLDARSLTSITDALRLLHGSPALTTDEELAVRSWFGDYAHWLATGKSAVGEHAAANNHGSWYLVQTVAICRYLGCDDEARRLCEEDRARIAQQIKPDGTQPAELARADGLGYSVFNLEAQFKLAHLAEGLGIDLWHYASPDGASLKLAFAYLLPFNGGQKKWPGTQYRKINPSFLNPLIPAATRAWPELFGRGT